MSKAKLYKVRLVQGFNAKGRQRAGVVLQKNATIITELSKEQLKALNEDVWIEVSDAPEGAEATAPGDNFSDAVVAPESEAADSQEDAEEESDDQDDSESGDAAEEQAEATAEAEEQAADDAAEEAGSDLPEAGDLDDAEKAEVNEDQAEATAEAEQESAEDAADSEEVEISADMKRPELEAIAKEVGIENPSDQALYPNKPTLVKAIQEASAKTEE